MTTLFTVIACATCYGDPGSPMTRGLNLAIITMLGVTALVLGGCAMFMVVLARRERRCAATEGVS
ncbi:MAG: hypothetical protein GWM87_11760 [Xanthomonadales bacterium]|nr:hypothetical protein [Xanthomonadales bacterium]NIX13532.1 hypothetical protein [Xanthomonadales bacterium]